MYILNDLIFWFGSCTVKVAVIESVKGKLTEPFLNKDNKQLQQQQ